jgi:hypothetical protein
MIVLRDKEFSVPNVGETISSKSQIPQQEDVNSQELTSRDLLLEQMRLQRQQRLIQHQKAQLQVKENMARARALAQQQRLEREKGEDDQKDSIRIKQMEENSNVAKNTSSLYKTKSRPITPISMPK